MTYHLRADWLPRAWIAVDLFLVVSGYLITSIILKYGRSRGFLGVFYVRRALRIMPVYALVIAVLAAFSPVLPQRCNFAGLPYHLTYMHTLNRYPSIAIPEFSPYLLHTWTIAVEEQFYLCWPLLTVAGGRMRVLGLGVALVVMSVLARLAGIHWWTTLGRLDALALGGVLAALFADRLAILKRMQAYRAGFAVSAAAGLATLVISAFEGGFPMHGPPPWSAITVLAASVMWFGLVGLVVMHTGHPVLRILRRPRICFLGQMSYSLYLYHLPIFWIAHDCLYARGITARPFWSQAVLVLIVVALGVLSFQYVELPLHRFKDRFRYGRLLRHGLSLEIRQGMNQTWERSSRNPGPHPVRGDAPCGQPTAATASGSSPGYLERGGALGLRVPEKP
jgi:peptidoglycan/LPS O-acetylase OafA/YrhL